MGIENLETHFLQRCLLPCAGTVFSKVLFWPNGKMQSRSYAFYSEWLSSLSDC